MKTLFYLLLIVGAFSCKKYIEVENIVEVDKKYSWTELKDNGLSFNEKQQLNSCKINDSIIGFVNDNVVQQFNANTLIRLNSGNAFIGIGLGNIIGKKPFYNDKLLINTIDNYSVIRNTKSPVSSYSNAFINVALTGDTNFVQFKESYIQSCTNQAVIDNKYILYPIKHKQDNTQQQHVYIARIKDTIRSGEIGMTLDKLNTIKITPTNGTFFQSFGDLYSLYSAYNKFFISKNDNFYRVDTTGNVKSFGAPMYSVSSIFILNNLLFAINPNGRIYVSSDKGENFSLFLNSGSTSWGFLSFAEIDNEVFAYYNDQLWELTLNGNTLNTVELKNDGLIGNKITSVTKCGNKFFVTTLSGVYYRDASLFKIPK
jgi:hypothetical protein